MKKADRPEEGAVCGRCGQTNRPERSFCRKCGCWLKPKQPARAPTRIPKAKKPRPIPAKSPRREAETEERKAVVTAVRTRDRTCRAAVHGLTGITCAGPLDVHEIIPRSGWPGGYLVVDNCLLVCRAHHRWIDNHPVGAHALGLHGFSWERPDRPPMS